MLPKSFDVFGGVVAVTRREATIVLLETRDAWVAAPRSQFGSFGAVPGEKATERRPCKVCDELGTVTTRKGTEPCDRCGGRGWFLVDGYTGQREPEKRSREQMDGAERAQWRRQTDAALQRLNLQLATPSEVSARTLADEQPERWERERDRHYRHGDYRALDLALEHFSGAPAQLATWTFEYRILDITGNRALERAAHAAVDLLNTRMPEEIRVPHWYIDESPAGRAYRERQARRMAA